MRILSWNIVSAFPTVCVLVLIDNRLLEWCPNSAKVPPVSASVDVLDVFVAEIFCAAGILSHPSMAYSTR